MECTFFERKSVMLNKKLLVTLIAIGLIASSSVASAAANPFSDLPSGHWAYNAVTNLTAEKIFNGYGDGTFRGDRYITRYEAFTLFAKLIGFDDSGSDRKVKFNDVPADHWAHKYISFLTEKGISKGYDDNTFRGDRYITRYEMSHMIAKEFEFDNVSKENANPFADVKSSHWAFNSVIKLAAAGIINGYGDGTFNGNRNITRYEAANMVAKFKAQMKSQ